MKTRPVVFLAILWLILTATSLTFTTSAAFLGRNPTRDDTPRPKKEEPNKQALLLLPPILTIHDFTFKASYLPDSTLARASGTGNASFGDKSDNFHFSFKNLVIKKQDAQHGTVIAGSIDLHFNPAVAVHWKGFDGKVSHLYLDPQTDSAEMRVVLPTLWTRQGEVGNGSMPKRAYLNLAVRESNQELELYLPGISAHNLQTLGLGDTQILMNCQNVALDVDLSKTQPGTDPAGLSIGFNGMITTVPQKSLSNTNAGFCFGQYTANGGKLTSAGFKTDFELKEKWTYNTSIPQGYEVTLFPKGSLTPQSSPSGLNSATGSLSSSLTSSSLMEFADIRLEPKQSEMINPADLKLSGNDLSQVKPNLAPEGTLRIIESAVNTGTFSGTLRLPKCVTKPDGSPLGSYQFFNFHVDEELNISGNIKIYDPVCWGRTGDGDKPVYGLKAAEKLEDLPIEPPRCFFPGLDQPKLDLTKLNSQSEEEFVNPGDLWQVPGVTFLYFTLGITSSDANHPIFIPHVLPPEYKQFNGPDWFFWQAPGGNNCWLNIGMAGVNGHMEIQTNIGLHQYPIKLGNKDPQYAKGNVPFQSYLHAYPAPKSENRDKISGPFFHAKFIDGAVFDLGVNGHFRVDGPSCIDAEFENLSATSTADLTSATVKFKGNLKYWGVIMDTGDNSKIVPRVSQVFLLKAEIGEPAHFENPFPVVWGRMIGDGNIPEVIFGYGMAQSFDRIPYSYTDVKLSTWDKNDPESHWDMKPGERWGAICSEGVLSFPYFGPRVLKIDDYMHDYTDPTEKARRESREILDNNRNELFFVIESPHRITWGDPVTATFDFGKVPYYDGEEYEDGFGSPMNPLGTVTFRDFKGDAPAIIHFVGKKVRVTIPQDPNAHPFSDDSLGLTLNHLQTEEDIVIDNEAGSTDSISEIKLKGRLDGENSLVGGFSEDFSITMRPESSAYRIISDSNTLSLDFSPISINGKVTVGMTYADHLFTGTVNFNDVSLGGTGGVDYSGHAFGQFSIGIGPNAKYIQGYGKVVIYGVPWPIPNEMAGALFLGYGAKGEDVYALAYFDQSLQDEFKGQVINGFYLAGEVGYERTLGFLGEASISCYGGTGYLLTTNGQTVLFQGGFGAGIEVIGIGLYSSTDLASFVTDFSEFKVHGTLEYTLSLWFFDFSWSGSVWLDSEGAHV